MSAAKARTLVALLRGINVGGKNKLPMSELVSLFATLGLAGAKAYIQSGNVIFSTHEPPAKDPALASLLESRIAKVFHLRVPVVLRTAAALVEIVANNPFATPSVAPNALHVGFLSGLPAAEAVAKLDPRRSPPDQFAIRGSEVFLMCPNGVGKTKLTNDYFDRQLGTTSTFRNWRTVTTLLAMADP